MSSTHFSYLDASNSIFNFAGRDTNIYNSQDRDTLDKLRPVTMDASSRIECLTDTRTGILKFIVDWVNSSASDQNILWLHGLAGSGKSTLSTTIANIFREDNLLGAFLFFDRDITERSDPTVVIRTLAYQLASSDHRIGAAIRAVIEEDSNIWLSPLSRQFRKLVVEPILTIANYLPTIIIILDGLDECGTPADRAALLDVLVKEFAGIPSYFRTIVTSRAESDICDAFNFQSHILPHELDIKSHVNYDDILLYIRHHMSLICSKNRHLQLGPNWPGEGILCQLVEQASGLFVWASTACEFINGYDPMERLEVILRAEATSGAQAALDAVYRTALESIGHWDDESFISDFRNLMGIILVTCQPLSSTAIDAFLHFPENRPSMHVISLLGCVLQQSPRVRVLHPSFADFLLDKERCGRDMWLFNQPIYHQHLAFYCLEQMDGALKRNMCNMTFSGTLTKDKLSEVASYSCLFWIDHICTISDDIAPVLDRVYGFLLQHLLHWFEAMSILNRAKDTILQLNKLYAWMTKNCDGHHACLDFARDAWRFSQTFATLIESHPLLVYYGAVPFTLTTSKIYQLFHDTRIYPTVSGGFPQSWSGVQLLLSHTESVSSVAFSPDGTRIVSGSDDNNIHVWDAISGTEVVGPLQGHNDAIQAVAISSDGTRIASASKDKTLRVWDAISGIEVVAPLKGHTNFVTSVAFSPDSTFIVSGSDDHTVCVWDVELGIQVVPPLQGHKGSVNSVAFSSDGTCIVSGSGDNTVRVWDTKSGNEIMQPLHGHNDIVQSVAFSPDGTRIVSGSDDGTVRVWDAQSGSEDMSQFQGHNNEVNSVAFSPDGTLLVSGSADMTVRVWNVKSGTEVLPPLYGHDGTIHSVAFSADGTRIVSGSADNTVRVWDVVSGVEVIQPFCHASSVHSVAFSPNSSYIISGSDDCTVYLWNLETHTEMVPQLRGHDGTVSSVAFALNGGIIISGTDKTLYMWNAINGVLFSSFTPPWSSDHFLLSFIPSVVYQLSHSSAMAPIVILRGGWLVDLSRKIIIMKLPAMVNCTCSGTYEKALAIGTLGGQVIILQFPEELFNSSETQLVEAA